VYAVHLAGRDRQRDGHVPRAAVHVGPARRLLPQGVAGDTAQPLVQDQPLGKRSSVLVVLVSIVMLLTVILIIVSSLSPPHSFIPGLKPSFSANPSHRSFPFLLQD